MVFTFIYSTLGPISQQYLIHKITTDLCGKEVGVNLGPVTGQLQHIQTDHTLFANKKYTKGGGGGTNSYMFYNSGQF